MIHRILAALDTSESGRSAGQYAAYLGATLNAGVEALTVIDARSFEGPALRDFSLHLGMEPFEIYSQALRDALETSAREIVTRFGQDADAFGLPEERRSSAIEVGMIAETITTRGAQADLIVMGQHGENRGFSGGLLGSVSEQIVRRACRPVMVCPATFSPITSAVVAYDGSAPANDALHLAVDLASQSGIGLTVLIVVDGEQMDEKRAVEVNSHAENYLTCCDIESRIRRVDGYAEEQIITCAETGGHDLIVMGAFGRGRIRELIVGSTTEYVMRRSKVPVALVRR